MLQIDGAIVYSASDISTAARCEFEVLSRLDEVLGRRERLQVTDLMRDRAAELGRQHEQRVLDDLAQHHQVTIIDGPQQWTAVALMEQQRRTLQALHDGAPVVAQGGFFDGRFHGRADFFIASEHGYTVLDAKLASRAKPAAIMQVAAYADQARNHGIEIADVVQLHLGTGEVTSHDLAEVLPVFREHRARVDSLVDAHLASTEPVSWGATDVDACGRCAYCQAQLEPARSVRLVWGVRASHESALGQVGISTIEHLAASTGDVPGVGPRKLQRLRTQAALQLEQEAAAAAGDRQPVRAKVHTVQALDVIPAPDPGDIFFDFEGDPMWTEGDRSDPGLEYLFGWREAPVEPGDDGRYLALWAHSRAQEKQALVDFLDYLRQRRAAHPDMHVYHYAFYEPAALRRLAARHGVGGAEVEELLAAGVFVDLYEVVKGGMHISQRSYSIKKLEPLYMGEVLRDSSGVTDGGASVVAYAQACALRDGGAEAAWLRQLDDLADYNAYDCTSTLRLRDWLLQQRQQAHDEALAAIASRAASALGGVVADVVATPVAAPAAPEEPPSTEADVLAERLLTDPALAHDPAAPLVAAALGFHHREDEPFWAEHHRLLSAAEPGGRDAMEVTNVQPLAWDQTRTGRWNRTIIAEGYLPPGSTIEAGQQVFVYYDAPLPLGMQPRPGEHRVACYGQVLTRTTTATGRARLHIKENMPEGVAAHEFTPMLIAPGAPPRSDSLVGAIEQVAAGLLPGAECQPGAPALALLRRTPPPLPVEHPGPTGDQPGPVAEPGSAPATRPATVPAVVAAVRGAADSYVAVQGPPGTGKTALAAEVIADLVAGGWKVGVVAQSHAVVENLLQRVIEAGVSPLAVGKRAGRPGTDTAWRDLSDNPAIAAFLANEGGRVLGGTAWDFCNQARVPRESLDLLVIDEAGQFALANTIAVAVAAHRLLLVGDPQQLPQVSQGSHRLPVDMSALSWLLGRADVMPAALGFFLDRSWRLHPALSDAVSQLSYARQLHSTPTASARTLAGLEPGVHVEIVKHRGNSVQSTHESAVVIDKVRTLVGSQWSDGEASRPLQAGDIIVVAAYNAQVNLIKHDLDSAGFAEVRVGTVDRFQGQEAAVVIVSMAASSADSAPRGLRFLLSRNRINVAISRGQYAAIIVRSDALTRHLPHDVRALSDLGAFIALCDSQVAGADA